nr:F0F1 ATP synthase subunit alpha [Ktedonobacterales bacterium]
MALADEISRVIGTRIAQFGGATTEASMVSVGTVISVGDGIARIYGMEGAKYLEIIEFPRTGLRAIAFNLEEETVSAPILGDFTKVREGDEVRTTGRIVEVPVGDALFGRVVNALGEP